MVRAWESLAGLHGSAERCSCSDLQLSHVGCDCAAEQNLPIGCECGNWLRSAEEIEAKRCASCLSHKYQPGDVVLWNGENAQ